MRLTRHGSEYDGEDERLRAVEENRQYGIQQAPVICSIIVSIIFVGSVIFVAVPCFFVLFACSQTIDAILRAVQRPGLGHELRRSLAADSTACEQLQFSRWILLLTYFGSSSFAFVTAVAVNSLHFNTARPPRLFALRVLQLLLLSFLLLSSLLYFLLAVDFVRNQL